MPEVGDVAVPPVGQAKEHRASNLQQIFHSPQELSLALAKQAAGQYQLLASTSISWGAIVIRSTR